MWSNGEEGRSAGGRVRGRPARATFAGLVPEGVAVETGPLARTTAGGFPEGAVVATPDTLYAGSGLEGISTPAARNEVMRRSMNCLLR